MEATVSEHSLSEESKGGRLSQDDVVVRNKSKLEKLLAQPDIFDCLRRINKGLIKSYDDLPETQAQVGRLL